jgi:hypothetical protein
LLAQHRANLLEAGFEERSEQIQDNSRTLALVTRDGSREKIDFLFIDGDHTYEGVLADLNNWTPFIKQGGVVVLHDVAVDTNRMPHQLHYEVKRALDEWQATNAPFWEFRRSVDSTVVLQRTYVPARMGSEKYLHVPDADTTLSKQAAPAELMPTTDMVDVDDEVHTPVDPEIYDEPKEPPKRRVRKSKK